MSTSYGLRCRTCDQDSPLWIRNDPDEIRRLVAMAPAFALFHEALERYDGWHLQGIAYLGVDAGDAPSPDVWLIDHQSHDQAILDEYGDLEELAPPARDR